MESIPCIDCITLPICRSRYLNNIREVSSPLSNLYILIDMCNLLDDYFFDKNDRIISHRIFHTIDFLKGNILK